MTSSKSSRNILCKSQYVNARTLKADFPGSLYNKGFSPRISSLPKTKLEDHKINRNFNILRIATTLSSFNISIEPREIKYNDVKISPRCVIISPGGACVVFNFIENVLKQPSLASKKNSSNS